LTILTDGQDEIDVEALIRFGLTKLGKGRRAYCAVRDYQAQLGTVLEDIGFSAIGSESLLARALATRIPEVKLVPVRAS
jgi:hypothetical protein